MRYRIKVVEKKNGKIVFIPKQQSVETILRGICTSAIVLIFFPVAIVLLSSIEGRCALVDLYWDSLTCKYLPWKVMEFITEKEARDIIENRISNKNKERLEKEKNQIKSFSYINY